MSKPKGFKSGFKSFAKGLGEALDAAAKIAEENRQIERDARESTENAIREYERITGKPYPLLARPTAVSTLPWDPDRKGHLVNCRERCSIHHCLTCGSEAYTNVYCFTHRP